ncbi:MAG: hypothetical protein U0836_25985 [Pirellulales bacterium]
MDSAKQSPKTPAPYDQVAQAIAEAGYFTVFRPACGLPENLACAAHRAPSGGLGGKTFWILHLDSQWYLSSWGERYWKFPCAETVAESAIACLASSGPQLSIPDDVVARCRLTPVTEEELDEVLVESWIPAALRLVLQAVQAHVGEKQDSTSLSEALAWAEANLPDRQWREGLFAAAIRHVPKGYSIRLDEAAEGWVAEAVSDQDERVFRIGPGGAISIERGRP